MRERIKLAWRNLWRNKRRTLITAASIFFAVWIAISMRSFQIGSYDHMIHNVVEAFTGYIQIQHDDYWQDKTIENTIELNDELHKSVENIDNVNLTVPRLQSFALASAGEHTKGAMIVGTKPSAENQMTSLKQKLVKIRLTKEAIEAIKNEGVPDDVAEKLSERENASYSNISKMEMELGLSEDKKKYSDIIVKHATFNGKYLTENDEGVLVADRLAKYLRLSINDTLIIFGQGYHGVTAAGKYPIRGIIKFPSPQLDNTMIYMTLPNAQTLFGAENRISSLALNLNDKSNAAVQKTADKIKSSIDTEKYAVLDWREMNKELVQQIQSDNQSGKLMLGILYLIIAFGVFGTVLMMTAERKREFGVMVAIGMQKTKLAAIVILEMIAIGFLGAIAGIIGSVPLVLYFYYNPIRLSGEAAQMMENFGIEPVMPFAWFGDYYLWQTLIVILIVVVAIIYPVINITRIKVIKALRG